MKSENYLKHLKTCLFFVRVGQVPHAARRCAAGWTARVSEGVEIFFTRVQTGPGVQSASYKMSTGGKGGLA